MELNEKYIKKGISKKKYIKVDLKGIGLSKDDDRYIIVNSNGTDLKIKVNSTGERKKIHLSISEFELIVEMVKELRKDE